MQEISKQDADQKRPKNPNQRNRYNVGCKKRKESINDFMNGL